MIAALVLYLLFGAVVAAALIIITNHPWDARRQLQVDFGRMILVVVFWPIAVLIIFVAALLFWFSEVNRK